MEHRRVGRIAVELRESVADGAVHELPQPAGARRLRSELPCPSVNGSDSRSAGERGPAQRAHELTEGVRMLGPGFTRSSRVASAPHIRMVAFWRSVGLFARIAS